MKILNEIWQFFKLNFKWILVVVAILLLYLAGCFNRREVVNTITVTDTVTVHHVDTIRVYVPVPGKEIPGKDVVVTKYVADTSSIQALTKQYNDLVAKHTNEVPYKETLKFGEFGTATISDTIQENKIRSRSYTYDLKERIVTNTITNTFKEAPRNKVYVSAGFSNIGSKVINQFDAGVTLINKSNTLLQAGYVYNTDYNTSGFRIGIGKLIKLRK